MVWVAYLLCVLAVGADVVVCGCRCGLYSGERGVVVVGCLNFEEGERGVSVEWVVSVSVRGRLYVGGVTCRWHSGW